MRWGRYGVKSARPIVGSRAASASQADNDVAIAGIGEILLAVDAAGARSGMIRFSL